MKKDEKDVIKEYEDDDNKEFFSSEDVLEDLGISIDDLDGIDLEEIEREIRLEEDLERELEGNLAHLEDMDEDEAIIELDKIHKKNDSVLEKDFLSSLIEQNSDNKIVYYEVENIYSNKNKRRYKNRYKLRSNPPILIIKDDSGNEASFVLTENLTDELSDTLKQVKKAYLGFSGPENLDIPDSFLGKIGYYARNNPTKILFPIIVIFVIVMALL